MRRKNLVSSRRRSSKFFWGTKLSITCDNDKPLDIGGAAEEVWRQSLCHLKTCTLQGKMTQFRPCIDLHSGQVKQIVGGTLSNVAEDLKTNYVSKLPANHYAELYRKHNLRGGHVVKLGPGNEEAALEAVKAWPNGLQVAGGITDKNAQYWIEKGAEKVGCSQRRIVIHGLNSRIGTVIAEIPRTNRWINRYILANFVTFLSDDANQVQWNAGQ